MFLKIGQTLLDQDTDIILLSNLCSTSYSSSLLVTQL